MMVYDPALVDAFLAHHWKYRPVDATFMGATGHDSRLPPVGPVAASGELAEIDGLVSRIAATAEPDELADRLDRRLMLSELTARRAAPRSRFDNPAWYTGEAAFGVISLLLPRSGPIQCEAVLDRLGAIPAFLDIAQATLAGKAVPKGWVARAQREAAAMADFLRADIRLHDEFDSRWIAPAATAATAFERFSTALFDTADADPAVGESFLSLLMRDVHGLSVSAREAIALARGAFDRIGHELEEMAAAMDQNTSWQDQIAALSDIHPPTPNDVADSYRYWDERALDAAGTLVTAARNYRLDYRAMAPCFHKVASVLYFLFYRSPPAVDPGSGSVYWVATPAGDPAAFLHSNATALVKTIHAVHHGSIGHHTQNSRARNAASRLARLAGTDCALGLAFLGAGTLVEGWACYAQDLLLEAPGFYTPAEALLLKQMERRNAASVLVDIKLHLGDWSIDQAIAFYRDEAGFAPSRVEAEVIRNSMLPGSRLMYWLGAEGIRTLRKRWKGKTSDFHDTLLSFGHVPLAWIVEEMEHRGLLE